jgi:hypothetical protein
MDYLAVEHAVLLERIGRKLDFDLLLQVDEAHIVVPDHHLGHQRFILGHEGEHNGTGRDHGTDGVGGEILDGAGLGSLEFKQAGLVVLFHLLLQQLAILAFGLDPLVLQFAAVFGSDLTQLFSRLRHGRRETRYGFFLGSQVACLFQVFALLVAHGDLRGVAV